MKTCDKCNKQFNTKIIIDGKKRNLQNRKYCLECSPWGEHNTRKLDNNDLILTYDKNAQKQCTQCNEIKLIVEFYKHSKENRLHAYCKKCYNNQTVIRQRELKEQCVEYKGGKCQICGYNEYLGALEFHHRDPTQKDFQISTITGRKNITDDIKNELDKCDLLCATHHREVHIKMKGEYKWISRERSDHKKYLCQDCGNELGCNKAKRCAECFAKSQEKINWLPYEE